MNIIKRLLIWQALPYMADTAVVDVLVYHIGRFNGLLNPLCSLLDTRYACLN